MYRLDLEFYKIYHWYGYENHTIVGIEKCKHFSLSASVTLNNVSRSHIFELGILFMSINGVATKPIQIIGTKIPQ